MRTIAILTECMLPIPPTKGGAVETMVEYLINENEKRQRFHFTVYTRAEERAMELAKSYRYTDFVFIRPRTCFLNRLLTFISGKAEHLAVYIPTNLEFTEVLRRVKRMPRQDAYLFEAGSTWLLPIIERAVGREKLLVHLHWTGKAGRLGHMRFSHRDKSFRYLLPVSDYIGYLWEGMTGRPWEQIKPIYNCVDTERFNRQVTGEELQTLRERLHIAADAKVIVFTGRIVPEKGVKELVSAFLGLGADNTVLLIIGSANFGMKTCTPYEEEIRQMAENSGGGVILTGFVPNEELYKYYLLACMAVMPSKMVEAFCLVNIEMQAAGLPLIATSMGAIPEFSNKTAILLENDDDLTENLRQAMGALLADPERRQIMSAEGQAFAKNFSVGRYYERFCRIIDEMDGERRD